MPSKKPTAKMAGGAGELPKWQIKKFQKSFNRPLDNADTKCRMIASHDKMPTDPNDNKSSDWLLTSDFGMI